MGTITIRPGLLSDLAGIVGCHIAVWQATYAHLVAPDLAAQLTDYDRREARWRELLAERCRDRQILVATKGAEIAGFGMFGRGDPSIFGDAGEIKYLYVATAHQGQGVGKRLFGAMAAGLEALECPAVSLGVVRGNAPAIAFYEALGGRHAGAYTDPGPMWRSDNLIYRWDDIPGVIARCAPRAA